MGFLSSIFSSLGSIPKKEKSPEELRKEHGFDNFDDYMDKLKNYDIEAETHKVPSPTPQKKGKR